MIDSLIMGDTTLKEFFGGKSVAEKPQLERNPSGTRKWIKELSSLANVVVGHCARYDISHLTCIHHFMSFIVHMLIGKLEHLSL